MSTTPKKPIIQFLETPAERYVVIPLSLLEKLETLDDLEDEILAAQLIDASHRDEETLPHGVLTLEMQGMHPVRAWRRYRSITQEDLARRVGTSKAYISQIETGRRNPGLSMTRALAEALDAPLEILIDQLSDYEGRDGAPTTSANTAA